MHSITERLAHLVDVLDTLEDEIKSQSVTKAGLDKVQSGLDSIEHQIDSTKHVITPEHYALMLEVQALVHYARGDIEKATEFSVSANSYISENGTLRTTIITQLAGTRQPNVFIDCPEYFTVSTTRLVVLSIITGNLYLYYWFFRNWMSVKRHLRSKGNKGVVLPRLASLFFPLISYELFNRVRQSHADYGLDTKPVSAGAHAWGVFLLNRVLLSFIPVLSFQKHMNYIKKVAYGDEKIQLGTTIGEVVWVVFSIIFWMLAIIGYSMEFTQSSYTTAQDANVIAKGIEADSLTDQYNSCAAELNNKYDSVDTSSQSALDSYNAEYNACEAVRLKQNAAAAEYNRLTGN